MYKYEGSTKHKLGMMYVYNITIKTTRMIAEKLILK